MYKHIQRCTAGAAILVSLPAVCAVGVTPATAAESRPVAGDIRGVLGSVDLQRAFNEYKVKQAGSTEINTIGQNLDKVLQRILDASATFLPEADVRELAGLYEKTTASDTEKQRIGVLETKARSLGDELRNLQNLATPNDQQRARISELTAARQKGNEVLDSLKQDYQGRLSTRQGQLSQKITEDMRAAIAKVAREKNLAVVFDAAVAVYTSNDITADVIKQLNK